MITREMLREKTGYDSFLAFKRHSLRSAASPHFAGFTKYFYNNNKTVELNMRPEELFMAAEAETQKQNRAKTPAPKKNLKH